MSYIQVIPFDTSKAGKQKGLCEKNERLGFRNSHYSGGLPNEYGTAHENWAATDQHTDIPPAGVFVPLFFDYWAKIGGVYKNWGHTGVLLPDGRFWSDGVIYASRAAYEKDHDPVYKGWSTHFEGVQVIKKAAVVYPLPGRTTAYVALRDTNVRNASSTKGKISGSRTTKKGKTFYAHSVVTGQMVNENGIKSDKWLMSRWGNFTWAGNYKKK